MRIGYARVSTKDQSLDLQVDALREVGCEEVFTEVASGAKTARPVLDDLLSRVRTGDVLVIWKLDRLGRSLKHLVTLAAGFMDGKIGLISLNDLIDTTTPQGRLIFNIFASLVEFSLSATSSASAYRLALRQHVLATGKGDVRGAYLNKLKQRRWPRKPSIAKAS